MYTSSFALKALALSLSLVAGVEAQDPSSSASSSVISSASGSASASASSASTSASAGANPLIPSTISSGCQRFLTYLNGDETLAACTLPLVKTLSLFAPSASSSSYDASPSEVSDALNELCSTQGCSDSLYRTALTQFNGNCSAELMAQQSVVVGSYDTLYVLQPFRTAICSKDAEDGYCLSDIAEGSVPTGSTNASSALASSVAANLSSPAASTAGVNTTNSLVVNLAATAKFTIQSVSSPRDLFVQVQSVTRRLLRRQVASGASSVPSSTSSAAPAASSSASTLASAGPDFALTGILPNAVTWRAHSLPFLFLNTNMTSSLLCTQCTKTILASYVSWESRLPYALGLVNSPLLGQQGALWTGVGEVCGAGFLASTASQAGQASLTAGAGKMVTQGGLGLFAVALVALWM